jgi:hypothetical protein
MSQIGLAQTQITEGGGGGGFSHFFQITVNFGGYPSVHDVVQTVTGLPWVTAGSVLLFNIAGIATAQHGIEDGIIEGLMAQAESIVPGVGFNIHAYSPFASAGNYVFNCVGH